ncbi:hypothetical protein BVRB_6g142630 [Beta vulgaris subsp. vulgaris]|uniref:Uncharacterized protein n=1 Tax=Beta vulgaris subsp. vulgaris TaxID=3555 RepID=A0A0J8C7H9_BETVV|nr:hypothetical protein BVRB_6g142630 [Beta vulgaris subsp. vulgaris]
MKKKRAKPESREQLAGNSKKKKQSRLAGKLKQKQKMKKKCDELTRMSKASLEAHSPAYGPRKPRKSKNFQP